MITLIQDNNWLENCHRLLSSKISLLESRSHCHCPKLISARVPKFIVFDLLFIHGTFRLRDGLSLSFTFLVDPPCSENTFEFTFSVAKLLYYLFDCESPLPEVYLVSGAPMEHCDDC
jgi:hypothetical protein